MGGLPGSLQLGPRKLWLLGPSPRGQRLPPGAQQAELRLCVTAPGLTQLS